MTQGLPPENSNGLPDSIIKLREGGIPTGNDIEANDCTELILSAPLQWEEIPEFGPAKEAAAEWMRKLGFFGRRTQSVYRHPEVKAGIRVVAEFHCTVSDEEPKSDPTEELRQKDLMERLRQQMMTIFGGVGTPTLIEWVEERSFWRLTSYGERLQRAFQKSDDKNSLWVEWVSSRKSLGYQLSKFVSLEIVEEELSGENSGKQTGLQEAPTETKPKPLEADEKVFGIDLVTASRACRGGDGITGIAEGAGIQGIQGFANTLRDRLKNGRVLKEKPIVEPITKKGRSESGQTAHVYDYQVVADILWEEYRDKLKPSLDTKKKVRAQLQEASRIFTVS